MPILVGELERAREIQSESVALKSREAEQAVVATLLHSQPIGQTARTRGLVVLLGATRPDKIELEKGSSGGRDPATGWTISTLRRTRTNRRERGDWATVRASIRCTQWRRPTFPTTLSRPD